MATTAATATSQRGKARRTTASSAGAKAPALRSAGAKLGINDFKGVFDGITDNVCKVILGKEEVVRLSLAAIMCEGHVLFEDLPGTGKSMLARALSVSMNASNARVQCTPDLLPGDITGSSILDQRKGEFEFKPGPIFSSVLLVDEINRASPKTQSALLEAMAERRVTADGKTYDLPRPFIVLATQNPIKQGGTFPLPEAQVDRFLFKLSMGYLSRDSELDVMFSNGNSLPIDDLTPVMDTEGVSQLIQFAATNVQTSKEVGFYIVDLIQGTRNDPAISVGASPRASIAMLKASRVLAASDGRLEVYPDDVRAIASAVLAHRIVLKPEAVLRGEGVRDALERVVASVKPPLSVRG
ncbi:MAG: MoxR family ATPase [Mycobacteriales bacterium]